MNNQELMTFFRESAAGIDEAMRSELASVESKLLSEVLKHGIFNGGKRIRPQLTMLCTSLTGGEVAPSHEQTLKLAMVFEYLHAASLLHDDVVDHADLRRGKPTANAVWGIGPVILAGDFLLSRAMTIAGAVGGKKAMAIVGRATEAMVEAEFLQMQNAEERNSSEDNYFKVAAGKTGALIAAACEAGVYLAGGSTEQRAAIRLYGENIGLAFQIIDDLLDYQGDPGQTGKVVGNDLVEGKMTLPLIQVLRQASPEDLQIIEAILAAGVAEKRHRFAEASAMIKKYDGFGYAYRKAEELVDGGLSALACFEEGRERQILHGLAGYVLSRDK
ncbi:MAG: polyprenyl synthetase family protein [Desulfobulbaceae bacterium]|nr:polyprenyl synthetase family protein [Desulfobulbaceae bacterium]